MTPWLIIAAASIVTYATRLSGFVLGGRQIPRALDIFLNYVPAAVFAALITPSLGFGTRDLTPRLIGVIAATVVVLRVRQLWAGLGTGMLAYWLARALLHH